MRGENPRPATSPRVEPSEPAVPVTGPADDAACMAALVLGDKDALGALYDRHAGVLLALAIRLLGDRVQAEELVHDVFLEAWHHARDFDPARGSTRAWLVTRARSRALDRRASRSRHMRLAEQAAREPRAETSSADGVGLDARRMREEVARLPAELVDVLEMAYFEGLSFSEIAELAGIPLGTVKSRMARALSALREGMGLDVPKGAP